MSRQNKQNKQNRTKRQYTYFVKSKYFSESFIDEQFKSRGNWIKYDIPLHRKKKAIDFVYLDELFYTNPRYYSLPAKLKNAVNNDKRQISFKHNLVRNLLGDANGTLIALIDRIRMLDNDLIRLLQKVNTTLHLRGKIIESERVMEAHKVDVEAEKKFKSAVQSEDKSTAASGES